MKSRRLNVALSFQLLLLPLCSAEELMPNPMPEVSCGYEFARVATDINKRFFFDSDATKQELEGMAYTFKVGDMVSKEMPSMVLSVKEGWLLGSSYFNITYNRQQGGLGYLNSKGETVRLLGEPVEDIYPMPFGYVVVSGGAPELTPVLKHLELSDGALYVVKIKNDVAQIEKMFELNEEPKTSWQTKTGELIINYQNSSVLLSKNAHIKNIKCSDYDYPEED